MPVLNSETILSKIKSTCLEILPKNSDLTCPILQDNPETACTRDGKTWYDKSVLQVWLNKKTDQIDPVSRETVTIAEYLTFAEISDCVCNAHNYSAEIYAKLTPILISFIKSLRFQVYNHLQYYNLAFISFVMLDDFTNAKLMLAKGVDIDQVYTLIIKTTIFCWAVRNRKLPAIKFLIAEGASAAIVLDCSNGHVANDFCC